MLFQLLVLIVRDSVITLSAIAYNVGNNLDEVLLATVCTGYNENMFNRSRFFSKSEHSCVVFAGQTETGFDNTTF